MIYLVRHGEAEHNVNAIKVAGQANDSRLTELGIVQSKQLGQKLAAKEISVIYHSPAKRCIDTAKIIGKKLPNVRLIADKRLLEMAQGNLVGTPKFLVVINPITFFKLLFKGKDFAFSGGESFNQVADRFEKVVQEAENGSLIVTHGMAIRCYLARQNNWSVWRIIFTSVKNAQLIPIHEKI